MAAGFTRLRIASVEPTGQNAVVLGFSVPPELRQQFAFVPGQYLTLRADVNGEDVRRSYSICSALGEPECLRVGIRRVEGGVFSNFACELNVGDTLECMPPLGRFVARIAPDSILDNAVAPTAASTHPQVAHAGRRSILLLAAGSGITPCLSIASSVLDAEPDSLVALLYGNRSAASTMFRRELDVLKDRYLDRFALNYLVSRERQATSLLHGRIDAEKLQRLHQAGWLRPAHYDAIYVCGPEAMIDASQQALVQMGVSEQRILTERFVTTLPDVARSSTGQRVADNSHNANATPDGNDAEIGDTELTLMVDGQQHQLQINRSNDTILGAAQRAGIDLPFSCAGGMCCTCRCRILEGAAEMDVNFSLAEWEIRDGYTLACQSRATTARLTLDFDAV